MALVGCAIVGCEQHKKSTINENGTEIVKVRTPTMDTTGQSTVPANETLTVEGKVLSVINGKDGYTAELKTTQGKVFYVTISHSNLSDHAQYRTVSLGDRIKVTGDFWMLENKNQITVRQFPQ